jgi:hypothetical protein
MAAARAHVDKRGSAFEVTWQTAIPTQNQMQQFKPGSEYQHATIIWLSNILSPALVVVRTALLHRPAGDANLMDALHIPDRWIW